MEQDYEFISKRLHIMAYRGECFISNGVAHKFDHGQLRQMNITRLSFKNEIWVPCDYFWEGTWVSPFDVMRHGIEFSGTEEEVWHKIQSLNCK